MRPEAPSLFTLGLLTEDQQAAFCEESLAICMAIAMQKCKNVEDAKDVAMRAVEAALTGAEKYTPNKGKWSTFLGWKVRAELTTLRRAQEKQEKAAEAANDCYYDR